MKKIIINTIALLLMGLSLNAQSPLIEDYKLDNGLKIRMLEYGELPITSVSIYINVGNKNETPGQQGLTALTNGLLKYGNDAFSRLEQDNALFKMGTNISVNNNANFTVVNLTMLNKDLDKGLALLAAYLLKPKFEQSNVSNEIGNMLDFGNVRFADITELANVYSNLLAFGVNNPLGRYYYSQQIRKINVKQVQSFFDFNYTPKNVAIAIAGKVDQVKTKALIEKHFGKWQAKYGEANSVFFDKANIKGKQYKFVVKEGKDVTQSRLVWTKSAPKIKSKDIVAFKMVNAVFNNRLAKQIREIEGKTYGIYSVYSSADDRGVYQIGTSVRKEITKGTIVSVDKVLAGFYEKGLTEKDIANFKERIKNAYLKVESPSGLADFFNPLIYKKMEERLAYITTVDALDLKTLNKIVKKYYNPKDYNLVIAGSESVFEQLTKDYNITKFQVKDLIPVVPASGQF